MLWLLTDKTGKQTEHNTEDEAIDEMTLNHDRSAPFKMLGVMVERQYDQNCSLTYNQTFFGKGRE